MLRWPEPDPVVPVVIRPHVPHPGARDAVPPPADDDGPGARDDADDPPAADDDGWSLESRSTLDGPQGGGFVPRFNRPTPVGAAGSVQPRTPRTDDEEALQYRLQLIERHLTRMHLRLEDILPGIGKPGNAFTSFRLTEVSA